MLKPSRSGGRLRQRVAGVSLALSLVACGFMGLPASAAWAQNTPGAAPPALQPVAPIELQRYMGLWYEQARLPNRFQKDCAGQVSARYALRADGRVDVFNRCVRELGNVDEALGEARVVPVPGLPNAGRLEVRFAPSWLSWVPFVWGDYWILQLDPDYSVALVGTPNRQYLWILSRDARLSETRMTELIEHARTAGFAVDKLIRTPAEPALPRD